MMPKKTAHALLLKDAQASAEAQQQLSTQLQQVVELEEVVLSNSADFLKEIDTKKKKAKFALIDTKLLKTNKKILDSLSNHEIFLYSFEKIPLTQAYRDSDLFESLCRYPCINLSDHSDTSLTNFLVEIFYPEQCSGLSNLVSKEDNVIIVKQDSIQELGWSCDAISLYAQNSLKYNFSELAYLRKLYTDLSAAALLFTQSAKSTTAGIQICLRRNSVLFAIRFPAIEIKKETIIQNILNSHCPALFNAWVSSDFFQINYFKNSNELEIKCEINLTTKPREALSKTLILREITAGNSDGTWLNPPQNIQYLLIENILETLQNQQKDMLTHKNDVSIGKDEEMLVLVKLIHKKNQLVQQLTHRVQKEQAMAQEKNKKTLELLSQTKKDLEESKRELLIARSKLRAQETTHTNDTPKSNEIGKAEGQDESLDEINNSLKKATTEKVATEIKLELVEKKISIIEKKYTRSIQELKDKEHELLEAKAVITKLTKELNNSQHSAKAPATIAPMQMGNEEYEKKIKNLSAKIFEYQQKEHEMQVALKKASMRLEHAEIGIKSGGKDQGNKVKVLEKQLEQAKLKEKELLKKIDDLGQALKKLKSTKAA